MDITELDALLAAAKLPETTVPLCLRGDLQAEWETLDRQLAASRERGDRRLTGSADEQALARQIRDLEDEMQASTVTVRLRAVERTPWRKLMEAHPPRKDVDADKLLGVNQATFYDALIAACLVDEPLRERFAAFADKLTDAQYDRLVTAAWNLNRRDVSVPFSRNASRTTRDDGEK